MCERSPQVLRMGSGTTGGRPRQPLRMPLPYLVRALNLVRGDKLGWSERTFRRYVTPSKNKMDAA